MAMQLTDDWKEFIKCLELHGVEYVIVGGIAVAYHGYPRATDDMDVFVNPVHAPKLAEAVADFGFQVPVEELDRPKVLFQMGQKPFQIEVMNFVSGLDFETAYRHHQIAEIDGLPMRMIRREELLINKRASGRAKDVDDLEHL